MLADTAAICARVLGANELLQECREAGVEILTGTCSWGSFRPGANSTHLATPPVGLADAERSWMIDYDNLILAPGSRDSRSLLSRLESSRCAGGQWRDGLARALPGPAR